MDTNLKEIDLTEKEAKIRVTGFCTIFTKKKRKPLGTFNTVGEFTENHGKAAVITQGLLGPVDEETFDNLRDFSNGKAELSKKSKKLIEQFDSKYDILVGKN